MTLGNNEMKLESVDSVSEAKPNDIEAGKKEEDEVKEIAGDAEGEEEEVVLSPDQELRYHVAQANEEEVTRLHQEGADVNAQDLGSVDEKSEQLREEMGYKMKIFPKITGDYPLHIAAQHGHTKIVSQLFYLGAKMENRNRIGATALHRAISSNKFETVKELLNLGADVHATTKIGQTPLHIAVSAGYLELIKLLLENGAKDDLRARNKVAMTPIEYTFPKSPERELLLQADPTLQELIADEVNKILPLDDDDEKQ